MSWRSTPGASRRPSPKSSPRSARIRRARASERPRGGSPRRTPSSSPASARIRSSTWRRDRARRRQGRARRAGAAARHRVPLGLRAPPAAVHRRRPRRLRARQPHRRPRQAAAGGRDARARVRSCRSGSPSRSPTRSIAGLAPARRARGARCRARLRHRARCPPGRQHHGHDGEPRHAGRPGRAPAAHRSRLIGRTGGSARARTRRVRGSRADDHGRPQRHARLVQRRRQVRRARMPRSPTASRCAQQGAGIIDVGGESTRPGAERVAGRRGAQARAARSSSELVARGVTVSIDTMNADDRAGRRRRRRDDRQRRVGRARRPRAWPASSPRPACTYVAMHWRGGADVQAGLPGRGGRRARRAQGPRRRAVRRGACDPDADRPRPGPRIRQERRAQLGAARADSTSSPSLGHGILIGASRKRFLGALLPGGRAHRRTATRRPRSSARSPPRPGSGRCGCTTSPSTRLALDVWTAGRMERYRR